MAKPELKSQIIMLNLNLKVNYQVNPVPSDPSGILIEIFRKRIHLTENQEWLHKAFRALKK